MSVKVRRYINDGWEVDIRIVFPDGTQRRERRKAPVSSKSGAERWGKTREAVLLSQGPPKPRKEVPTLERFGPRFIDSYAKANRHKPSGVAAKETILRVHLYPLELMDDKKLGTKRLDAITNEDVQRVKSHLSDKAPKTVNNVLTVLNTLLKIATEWDVIDEMPCRIKLLPVSSDEAPFHDFDEYDRLVGMAKSIDAESYIAALLGGDAGLRCGEIMALEQTDLNFSTRRIYVQRSEWKGKVTAPKGGRSRYIPMTSRLAEALRAHRHLEARVLCRDGKPLSQKMVQGIVRKASRKANLAHSGVHVLRHTFCSHLAMRGAPAKAIQELAGHKDLKTTLRYMHLSPAAVESAIRLLEEPTPRSRFGEIVEAAGTADLR